MSTKMVSAWVCDFTNCGHSWLAKTQPARCAKCKRKNWNKYKVPKRQPLPIPAAKVVELSPQPNDISMRPPPVVELADGVVKSVTILSGVIDSSGPAPEPKSERLQAAAEALAAPHPKIGEKCPHGWANWMQCPKCNSRKS